MVIGIAGAMLSFVLSYASLKNVTVAALRLSPMVRTFEEQAVLASCRGKVVTISLSGFIFFGSAVQLLEEVKRHVIVVDSDDVGVSDDVGKEDEQCARRTNAAGEHTPLLERRWSMGQSPSRRGLVAGQWAASSPIKMHSMSSSGADQRTGASLVASPSEASSAPSFSYLQTVNDMSSDQIMRHHEKWGRGGGAMDCTPLRSKQGGSSVEHCDVESGCCDGAVNISEPLPEYVSHSDDEEKWTPPGVGRATASQQRQESLLQAIWSAQVSEPSMHCTRAKHFL